MASKAKDRGRSSPGANRSSLGPLSYRLHDSPDGDKISIPSSPAPARKTVPPANYPPTAKDWENHRQIFTRLYRVENKTLDQVMEIMKNDYGFKATPRMFKQRVRDWDLHKNYKAAERKELAQIVTVVKYHEVMGESHPRKVMLRGQPVKLHKIRKDLRNQNLSTGRLAQFQDLAKGIKSLQGQDVSVEELRRRLTLASAPVAPLPTPPQLKYDEIILRQTDIYYQSLSPNMLVVDNHIQVPLSRDFCNNVDMAFELLKSGRSKKGFQLLNKTSDLARSMFVSGCPETLCNVMYNLPDWSIAVPTDIFNAFWSFLSTMASTVLGDSHPVSIVCKLAGSLEPGSPIYETAFRIIVAKMEQMLGPGHKDTLQIKDRHNVLLSWSGNFFEAELLQHELIGYYDSLDKYSHNAICAMYRLGRILERRENLMEAEVAYREAVDRRDVSDCKECPSYIHSAIALDLVGVLVQREEYAESEDILEYALMKSLRLANRNDTVRILGSLDNVLMKLGKVEKAERLRIQHPNAF